MTQFEKTVSQSMTYDGIVLRMLMGQRKSIRLLSMEYICGYRRIIYFWCYIGTHILKLGQAATHGSTFIIKLLPTGAKPLLSGPMHLVWLEKTGQLLEVS